MKRKEYKLKTALPVCAKRKRNAHEEGGLHVSYRNKFKKAVKCCLIILTILFAAFLHAESQAFTLNVVDSTGSPVSGFRWLVEEDTTLAVTPGALVSDSIAVNIHSSYAPVVEKGYEAGSTATVSVPDTTPYVVSVLPDSGHNLSGASVAVGQTDVTVTVNAYPIPTAQISVFVFNDNNPINNAPDLPGESGLSNFSVIISDAGGQMMQDAFGNPLGTTYSKDAGGNYIINPDGTPQVETLGDGVILTDADGKAYIKFIPPGKYGVVIIPPHGENWVQTTTIEGSPTIDAWVIADEPELIVEFGPAFNHIFMGFVNPDELPWALTPPAGTATITGQVVNNHQSAPPAITGYPGHQISECWIGLNTSAAEGLYAQQCQDNGTFTFFNVPPGNYQLVIWDTPLDIIIGFQTVTISDTDTFVDLGQIHAFPWFGRLWNYVFYDTNENGFRDDGETGMAEQNVNIRFRDGTIYQAFPTDFDGYVPFDEVFPFFKWLVAEVDFARFKATGATIIVDAGGPVPTDNGWTTPSRGVLNPQPQADINPNTGNNLSRTETGEVLTQAFMVYAGQTNIIEWGKASYGPGENGGISGVVFYAITRAEDDPSYAVGEEWEPGIPRVQVNLYQDSDGDHVIDDLDGDGVELADVDNYPFGNFPGTEDQDGGAIGVFDAGDAISITTTDSWDDNMPTGCIQDLPVVHGQAVRECFDNFSTWNQVRPGVFDGGYAFGSYHPGGIASGSAEVEGIPEGQYIVEAVPPPGYELLKEEDKNVDYGDEYEPSLLLLPPPCVGADHTVPAELVLFPGIAAPYAGESRPLCDRKAVDLFDGKNAAADFFFYTEVPKAARAVGNVNNDLAAEGDVNNPVAGEKQAISWIPISFQDFAGNELVRVYTDEFGAYNALLPSTFTVNIASPTGVSPNMLNICLNHPGPIEDPLNPGTFITDPYYNPSFSHVCYTFNFAPGVTTYLDTPVIPVGAFVSAPPGANVDLELPDGTPVINEVNGPGSGGPYVTAEGQVITITSLGSTEVPNPDYDLNNPIVSPTIFRDYGFGSVEGTVSVGGVDINPANVTWAVDGLSISVTVPAGLSTGQLNITRGDNLKSTVMGITLHVDLTSSENVIYVTGTSIQDAIDAASNGDLIIVKPGTYEENVILWKNVRLQGTGAPSTVISALAIPSSRLTDWRNDIQTLIDGSLIDLVAGQATISPFADSEAPGITVLPTDGDFSSGSPGLIDGFTVGGASTGGGIFANGFAHYLEISNNRVSSNLGTFGGGIRIGSPALTACTGAGDGVTFGCNDHIDIHHNLISQNTGTNGGGGITLFTGADNYTIADNFIIGNFARLNGGGVSHIGLSHDGTIADNTIVFNEVFFGGELGGNGGGIYIGGEDAVGGGLSAGSGSVIVDSNLLQGNLAGSGNGGGICAVQVNGLDVQNSTSPPFDWYSLNIANNMVVNNVAATEGGGIYLQDVARGQILNNTVANNDSTATSADALAGGATLSTPQGAGIVSGAHSADLQTASGQEFSNPALQNNIIWHNNSYYRDASLNDGLGGLVFSAYWDLQVSGTATAQNMFPQNCVLTDTTGYDASNISGDPLFVLEYTNTILSAGAGDEGGNFVNVTPTPLVLSSGDYHITAGSPAIDQGATTAVADDFDGESRPAGAAYDIGADEYSAPVTSLFMLTVSLTGTGLGTVTSDPVGIDCGGDCVAEYTDGTSVTLTAAPDAGYFFSGWSGGGCAGTGTCVVTMNADTAVAADFTPLTSFMGIFRGGDWYLDTNGNGILEMGVDTHYKFGNAGHTPVTGDWNGDGTTEIGLFRNGNWYIDNGDGAWNAVDDTSYKFGRAGDVVVTGDWDGDGTTETGLFRDGNWFLDDGDGIWGSGPDASFKFGRAGDVPVTGDWDGDGTTETGLFRDGNWFLDDGDGIWGSGPDASFKFGRAGDMPVTGDWTADGDTEIGFVRNGSWYLDNGDGAWSGCATDGCFSFGSATDQPVTGRW
jgi:parallel beta-helix repeat protein